MSFFGALLGSFIGHALFSGSSKPLTPESNQYNKDVCARSGCTYASRNAPRCPFHHPFGEYFKKEEK